MAELARNQSHARRLVITEAEANDPTSRRLRQRTPNLVQDPILGASSIHSGINDPSKKLPSATTTTRTRSHKVRQRRHRSYDENDSNRNKPQQRQQQQQKQQ